MGKKPIHCKYCGAGPFKWSYVLVGSGVYGWRLVDDLGIVHSCRANRAELIQKAVSMGLPEAEARTMKIKALREWIDAHSPTDDEDAPPQDTQNDDDLSEVVEFPKVEDIPLPEGVDHVHPNFYKAVRYFKTVPQANQWWAGPAGSGKTTLGKHVAQALGKQFVLVSISKNTAEFDLLGYMDGHGRYVAGKFYDAVQGENKLIMIDECDRGTDGVLVALNAALDQRMITFPNGERIDIHPTDAIVATGNTWGRGADAVYSAASQLDAAFLDRFQIKLAHEYDEEFELKITVNRKWTRFVQTVRKAVFDLKLQGIVISPRASRDGGLAINGGIPWSEVEQDVIWSCIPAELQPSIRERMKLAA